MAITPGEMNLIALLVSIAMVYYFYPEYIAAIGPLFIAITLYFSSDDVINSMFVHLPSSTYVAGDFIKNYKMYLVIGFSITGFYYTYTTLQKHKKIEPSSESSSDMIDTSSLENVSSSDTSYSKKKSPKSKESSDDIFNDLDNNKGDSIDKEMSL